MPTMHIAKTNDLAFLVCNLTIAEARYLEEWRPDERARTAKDWRNLYFKAFRLMAVGQVYDDGYHVAIRHEDRLEITVRARAERKAS